MISTYLTDILILLVAAVLAVPLFQLARLGTVPGFLVAGVVVGPSGLGLIDNVEEIGHLAEIGVVLLLFVIGIELKPSRLWLMRRLVFGLGSLQVIITGAVLAILIMYVFEVPLNAAILLGPALALSSTAFVLQLLTEQKKLSTQYGRSAFAVLLLQDLAVVPLLALLPLLTTAEYTLGRHIGVALLESLVILALIVLGGRYFLQPILHRVALTGSPEIFTASAVLVVLGSALLTEHIGLSMAMGAFIAGLLISDSAYRHQVMAEIQPFRGLLLGLFFVSMGMSLNLSLFMDSPLQWFVIVAFVMATKAAILWPLARLFGCKGKNGLAIALLLSQSGEFALVLFALAFQSSLIDSHLFQQLLLIVLLSMLLTPLLAGLANRLAREQPVAPEIADTETETEMPRAPIVITGFGRVGHRIGDILASVNQPFVALDSDPLLVERERAKGHPVFFGDVRQPEVLKAAGASNARLVIVTLNAADASEQVVAGLRRTYPGIHIVVRGQKLEQCRRLRSLGANMAISENVEASIDLAGIALTEAGFHPEQRQKILDDFRRAYYRQIDDVLPLS